MTEVEILGIVKSAQKYADHEIEKHRAMIDMSSCRAVYYNSLENFCIEQVYEYFSEYLGNLTDEEVLKEIKEEIAEGLDLLCRKNAILKYLSHELCDASTVNPTDFYRVVDFIEERLKSVTESLIT